MKTRKKTCLKRVKGCDKRPFDKPFENLRVLSSVEGLTAIRKVEGQVTSNSST